MAPDFVGLTDVAQVVGVSRQNMRKLMVSQPTSFPPPVHEGSSSVWHLAEVMAWMQARGTYTLEQAVLDVAVTAMQVNLAKEARQITPRVRREVRLLVA